MSDCTEITARLSGYLDGESGDQEVAIRAHLDSCAGCRRALEELRQLSRRLRESDEPPAGLVARVQRRVREEGPRRRAKSRISTAAAAAAILAGLLWALVVLTTANGGAPPLSDLVPSGGLSEPERRILKGDAPTRDEWMSIVLSGGSPR